MDYTYEDIAKMIDHSLLNPKMTDEEMDEEMDELPEESDEIEETGEELDKEPDVEEKELKKKKKLAQIDRLSELVTLGVLTEEEFEQRKKKILEN